MRYCPDCRCCHWASLLSEGCRWDTLLILHPMTSIDTTWFVQPIQSTTLLQNFMHVPVFCICSLHMGCSNTSCYYHLPGLSSNWVAIVHPDVFDSCCCSFTNTLSKIIFKVEVRGEVKSKLYQSVKFAPVFGLSHVINIQKILATQANIVLFLMKVY